MHRYMRQAADKKRRVAGEIDDLCSTLLSDPVTGLGKWCVLRQRLLDEAQYALETLDALDARPRTKPRRVVTTL